MAGITYCDECGGRLTLYVVGVCSDCGHLLTGEDPERDEHERRADNASNEGEA